MKRLKDGFLDTIESVVPLRDKQVLEIGCGGGNRTIQIAKRCAHVIAIDPDEALIRSAQASNSAANIEYLQAAAEMLPFEKGRFDVAIFTLSLHHVPCNLMGVAIDQAIRVAKKGGHVVFLEPALEGSFFEAEIAFDACDGDERMQKAEAYQALSTYSGYLKVAELQDETIFSFDSIEDFVRSMNPKKNLDELPIFLEKHKYILNAERRINVFQVR